MASCSLHFPSAEVITRYLSNHDLLKIDYFKEKEITDAVSRLAAARFANSDIAEMGVKLGAHLIAYDLQNGEDGFTGEKITKIGGLPQIVWNQFSMNLESALIDCAKNAVVTEKVEDEKEHQPTATSLPTLQQKADSVSQQQASSASSEEHDQGTEDSAVKSIIEKQHSEYLLQGEFDSLIERYHSAINYTSGCGERSQHYVDSAYEKLLTFAEKHQEFKSKLPKKHIVSDDGTGGVSSGIGIIAANATRNDGQCAVQ